jgi:hypothetical protein
MLLGTSGEAAAAMPVLTTSFLVKVDKKSGHSNTDDELVVASSMENVAVPSSLLVESELRQMARLRGRHARLGRGGGWRADSARGADAQRLDSSRRRAQAASPGARRGAVAPRAPALVRRTTFGVSDYDARGRSKRQQTTPSGAAWLVRRRTSARHCGGGPV